MKYHVVSGSMNEIVDADSPENALNYALLQALTRKSETGEDIALGTIAKVAPEEQIIYHGKPLHSILNIAHFLEIFGLSGQFTLPMEDIIDEQKDEKN